MQTNKTKKNREKSQSQYQEFGVDYLGFMQTAETNVLSMVIKGKIDLNLLAREEMANRGLNENGEWVGFDKAEEILLNPQQEKESTCRNLLKAAQATLEIWNKHGKCKDTPEHQEIHTDLRYAISDLYNTLKRS